MKILTADVNDKNAMEQLNEMTPMDKLLIAPLTRLYMNPEQEDKYLPDFDNSQTVVLEDDTIQLTSNDGTIYTIGLIPIESEDEIAPTIDDSSKYYTEPEQNENEANCMKQK